MASSWTSFEDGDPSSPEHFNAKFAPVLSGVSGVTGLTILSNGSSLGTATSLNFVNSSSVSSQGGGQISIAVTQISGTSGYLPVFNSGGTGITDSVAFQDSAASVVNRRFQTPARFAIQRAAGSSTTPAAMGSNTEVGGIEWHSYLSDSYVSVAAMRYETGSVTSVSAGGALRFYIEQGLGGGSSLSSIVEMTSAHFAPSEIKTRDYTLGTQGRLFGSVNAQQCIAWTANSITAAELRTYLQGAYPNGGNNWTIYGELLAEATSLRIGASGNNESGTLYVITISSDEAYLSVHTGPAMRIGSNTTRFHSLNVLGVAVGTQNKISSYSATTTDCVISVDSTSATTVTLPAPSTVSGHLFTVKRAGSGSVEVNASSGASLDNLSVYTLGSQWSVLRVASIGTRYAIL